MQTKPSLAELAAARSDRPVTTRGDGLRATLAWDGIGAALVGALALWTVRSQSVSGGNGGPLLALLGTSAGAFILSRVVGAASRSFVPLAVAGIAAAILIRSPHSVTSSAPLGGSFDYPNARAAFFALAAAAALMVPAASPRLPIWVAGLGAAAVLGTVPILAHSVGGVVQVAVLPIALAAGSRRAARAVIVVAAAMFVLAFATTAVLGAGHRPGHDDAASRVARTTGLTDRRLALWHDALVLLAAHPVDGVGPDRFQNTSPTARSDADTRQAHQEFLQVGAEEGVIGLTLLVLLFLWGFARLWASGTPDRVTAIGGLALAGLAMHASVDYVLHFPAIPIAAAALVGTAVAARRRPVALAGA